MSEGKIDDIELQSLLHAFNPTYSVEFIEKNNNENWFHRKP
jgi:hypothetical protein